MNLTDRVGKCGEYCPVCATELNMIKSTRHRWCPNGSGIYGCDWEAHSTKTKTLNKSEALGFLIEKTKKSIELQQNLLKDLEKVLWDLQTELRFT